jgi:hypothetical protein
MIFAFLAVLYAWENEWVRSYQNSSTSTSIPSAPAFSAYDSGAAVVAETDFEDADVAVEDFSNENPFLQKTKRLPVCVVSSNPRTASIFSLNLMRRLGDGKFDYVVVSNPGRCPNNVLVPQLRMMYQKTLAMPDLKRLVSHNSLVVVAGDEFCRCTAEFCNSKGQGKDHQELVFARQYYSAAYPDTFYLPLGPRLEFPLLDEDFPRAEFRPYKYVLWSNVESLRHNRNCPKLVFCCCIGSAKLCLYSSWCFILCF